MFFKKLLVLCVFVLTVLTSTDAQTKTQQGLLLKSGTSIRLGGIQVLNKRNLAKSMSSIIGVFNILADRGDTVTFSNDNFQSAAFVVTDFADKIIYLQPVIQLDEVVVNESSIKRDIKDTQKGYREKSVFYTGTPHYYYLFLKPMTFIYENFKSEVKDARRFNRYATKEFASYKVNERFNDAVIKKAVAIKDTEIKDFELAYTPTLAQLNAWNDYDLLRYIRRSYADFKKNNKNI